jgi:Ca-activated chloride channel family protein
MLDGLGDFHFLRPAWLLLIPFAWAVLRRSGQGHSARSQWKDAVAPHLLPHLVVGGGAHRGMRPATLFAAALVLAGLAMAGPTWRREITPFTEDTAPLVVVFEMTPDMLATDEAPTRLDRAKQKLRDLLDARPEARTAVLAYAGSAHTVLPLTDDPALIEAYLPSLTPSLMPTPGDRPDTALSLAVERIAREEVPGTVLFLTDGIDRRHAAAFGEAGAREDVQILALAFGGEGGPTRPEPNEAPGFAAPVDLPGLQVVIDAAGGSVTRARVDDRDVRALVRQIRTHLVNTAGEDEALRWRDAGYALVWPLAATSLLWFRRGWTIRWR